jgi:hypothetical protein
MGWTLRMATASFPLPGNRFLPISTMLVLSFHVSVGTFPFKAGRWFYGRGITRNLARCKKTNWQEMRMIFKMYILTDLIVLLLALGPFLRDSSNPKGSFEGWAFLMVAVLLGPIVLPNMIVKRIQKRGKTPRTKRVFHSC